MSAGFGLIVQLILKPNDCDVRRLPLGALEAFILSRIDGHLDLDEIAEVTGLDSAQVQRAAKLLLELGAVSECEDSRPPPSRARAAMTARAATEEKRRPARIDPRAEQSIRPPKAPTISLSIRPQRSSATPSVRPPKPSAVPSMHPPKAAPAASMRPPPRRRSNKSIDMKRVAPSPATRGGDEVCELDEATLAAVTALHAKLAGSDYYVLLGVERGAEKKAIKRAYFGFASKYHPDRFFGKKLGAVRAQIERIFHRMTEAHDTLTNADRRKAYDATLRPLPTSAASAGASARSSRKMSKAAMKAASRQMKAASRQMKAASRQMKATKAASLAPPPSAATPAPAAKSASLRPTAASIRPKPATIPPVSRRQQDLRAGVIEGRTQGRIDLLVQAAQAALQANDIVGAANSYRLALEHRDDPRLRMILDDVDARARAYRFEKHMTIARAAERDQSWADAAKYLERALEAKTDCDVAWRAAKAIRLSNGDLARAATLAEQAVTIAPRNAAYRVTLAEIYLATNRLQRATEECETARGLAPKDEQVKELAAHIAGLAKSRP